MFKFTALTYYWCLLPVVYRYFCLFVCLFVIAEIASHCSSLATDLMYVLHYNIYFLQNRREWLTYFIPASILAILKGGITESPGSINTDSKEKRSRAALFHYQHRTSCFLLSMYDLFSNCSTYSVPHAEFCLQCSTCRVLPTVFHIHCSICLSNWTQ